jgi:DNA repair protein RadB
MKVLPLPAPLDGLVKGVEYGAVTNIFGGPGTGKTNCCILASIEAVKAGKNVVYMDTEGGFSPERVKQLAKNYQAVLKNIVLAEPKTFSEQNQMIKDLANTDAGLIVVDSIVALYRLEYTDPKVEVLEANRALSKQMATLSNIAREKQIPILVTAHTFKNWDTGDDEIIGGNTLKYWSKAILFLERTGRTSERRASIVKHRHMAEGDSVKFMIVQDGFKPAGFKIF